MLNICFFMIQIEKWGSIVVWLIAGRLVWLLMTSKVFLKKLLWSDLPFRWGNGKCLSILVCLFLILHETWWWFSSWQLHISTIDVHVDDLVLLRAIRQTKTSSWNVGNISFFLQKEVVKKRTFIINFHVYIGATENLWIHCTQWSAKQIPPI